MTSRGQGQTTYDAILTSLSGKLNLRPRLSKVTLANVLSGDTCPPISLADLEAYLTFKEHNLESLQFVVWFQDYRDRYLSKPPIAHSLPKDPLEDIPRPSFLDEGKYETCSRLPNGTATIQGLPTPEPAVITPTSPSFSAHSAQSYQAPSIDPLNYNPSPTEVGSFFGGNEKSPSQQECMRIIATFFQPGSPKELNLLQDVRDAVIKNVASTSNPNVFLPVYEEVYQTLETTSLRHFLIFATGNINLTKQLYWYGIGLVNVCIGLAIAVSLIMTLSTPPEASRAYRLLAIPFAALGAMQFYSAWRGFCSQLWRRGKTQMRVWELQEMDEEARIFYEDVISPSSAGSRSNRNYHTPWDEEPPSAGIPKNDEAIAAEAGQSHSAPSSPGFSGSGSSSSGHSFKRPPIFGPEKVVLDPRISAVHQQVMHDIYWFGAWFTVGFAAVILSVPGRHQ